MHKRAQAPAATLMSGQALIVSLWILLALSVITISIAHRVSFSLRSCAYQRDRLKAVCLAKAGINRAIAEIKKDGSLYDSLRDKWADNEDVFKKIVLGANTEESSSVSYTQINDDGQPETIYGAIDEERKININTASQELLVALLKYSGFVDIEIEKVANNIRAWRGDPFPPEADALKYDELGYPCKKDKFRNTEELRLVKEITEEVYENVKGLITASTEGKININTASEAVLKIICRSGSSSVDYLYADSLASKINDSRNGDNNVLGDADDVPYDDAAKKVDDLPNIVALDQNEVVMFNAIKNSFTVRSNYFKIESTGNAGKINSKIAAIYGRSGKILYWHEN